MTEVKSDILARIAHFTDVKLEKLRPTDRLLEDLGMDGDDAVEFFDDIEKRHAIDFTLLFDHWDQHFGPESGTPAWILAPILGVLGLVGLAKLGVYDPLVLLLPLLVGLAIAGYFFVRGLRRRRERPHLPVTVADVLDAASSGRWTMSYP